MWIFVLVGVLGILALVGGILLGGVFTIVLVPLAVIAGGSMVLYAMWGASSRANQSAEPESEKASKRPLPHTAPSGAGHVRTTPERLADARRGEQ